MHSSDITFRNIAVEMEDLKTGQKQRDMEIIEIKFPDGKVSAFPATDVNAESGRRYCDLYARKYAAFKNGDPDPDHVTRLEREIAERQAELETLKGGKPKDDKRVQENLGYGKMPDPASNKAGETTRDPKDKAIHADTDHDNAPAKPKGIAADAPLGAQAFVPPTDAQRAAHDRDVI